MSKTSLNIEQIERSITELGERLVKNETFRVYHPEMMYAVFHAIVQATYGPMSWGLYQEPGRVTEMKQRINQLVAGFSSDAQTQNRPADDPEISEDHL